MTTPTPPRRFTEEEIRAISERLIKDGPVPYFMVRAHHGLEQYAEILQALETFKSWLSQQPETAFDAVTAKLEELKL